MNEGDIKEIADCRVGFIGFGAIARIAAKLCSEMGGEIVYNDIVKASWESESKCHATFVSRDELISTCDIISLHVPVTPQTENMVNAEFLSKMKKGSYIINTARGELVDPAALIDALKSGHLAGAGMDCIPGEPVQKDNPLINCDAETASKLLFSPHIGGITGSSFRRGYQMIYEDIMAVVRGDKPKRCVNM